MNRSRHNSLYWRNGEYLGFGVGAHSHFRGHRFGNGHLVRRYIAAHRGALAPAFDEAIDPATAMAETMLLGLRLQEGISRAAFLARHGRALDAVYGAQLAALAPLGVIEDTGAAVRLTARATAGERTARALPARMGSPIGPRRAEGAGLAGECAAFGSKAGCPPPGSTSRQRICPIIASLPQAGMLS